MVASFLGERTSRAVREDVGACTNPNAPETNSTADRFIQTELSGPALAVRRSYG